ncbi:MAG TPA: hypothetical protein DCM10_14480 [Xanthomarina gelatinilytica]|nr:hypothetical protein [Xanthomarina gelatinilytica]
MDTNFINLIPTQKKKMNNIRQSKKWNLLFDKLLKIQNTIDNIDILTITGFFTTIEELEKHVKRYSK